MQPTRRQVLAGAAVLGAAACTDRPVRRPSPPDPDVALRAAAVAREQDLLSRYDALLAAQPRLAAELSSYREDHVQHLRALAGPTPAPTPSATTPPVAGTRAALVAAERAAANAHAAATATASPDLARLLASLAACESTHVAVL